MNGGSAEIGSEAGTVFGAGRAVDGHLAAAAAAVADFAVPAENVERVGAAVGAAPPGARRAPAALAALARDWRRAHDAEPQEAVAARRR